jgi:hypothetical protein
VEEVVGPSLEGCQCLVGISLDQQEGLGTQAMRAGRGMSHWGECCMGSPLQGANVCGRSGLRRHRAWHSCDLLVPDMVVSSRQEGEG